MPITMLLGCTKKRWHQVWPAHAFGAGITHALQQPYKWHAISSHHSGLPIDLLNVGRRPALHQGVDVEGTDEVRITIDDPSVNRLQGLLHGHGADRNTKHVRPRMIRSAFQVALSCDPALPVRRELFES